MEKLINRFVSSDPQFPEKLKRLTTDRSVGQDSEVNGAVDEIIHSVREKGDAALLHYTNEFDGRSVKDIEHLEVADFKGSIDTLSKELRQALEVSADRIEAFHVRQKEGSWDFQDELGVSLGQKITPLDSVGVYVPGGTASYPSSVLMNTIPASVAGVDEIIMAVPAPDGNVSKSVLAAAELAGVARIFTIGGAQAIAALAFGTETIPKVDKIVGPGNQYVATAKKKLFGVVGIDMIAGPSEVLIICDGDTNSDWIAMDLLAQAEHDEDAQSILISDKSDFLELVEKSLMKLAKTLPRSEIIFKSLCSNGALILVDSLSQAAELANLIAPEHLELSVQKPRELLAQIRHAGAIFLGRYTPEVFGDYCAGPNHVLPTCGSAKYASPLGVSDFQKRSSVIECNAENALNIGKIAAKVAEAEGLSAHAISALMRTVK